MNPKLIALVEIISAEPSDYGRICCIPYDFLLVTNRKFCIHTPCKTCAFYLKVDTGRFNNTIEAVNES